MTDLTSARTRLRDVLAEAFPDTTIHTIEPEQIRPPAITIAPGDPWIDLTDDDHTMADIKVAWTVRVVVEAGPSTAVNNRLDAAAQALLNLIPDVELTSISQPHTLVVSDTQAFPALTANLATYTERT